jgi:hypothetical protein
VPSQVESVVAMAAQQIGSNSKPPTCAPVQRRRAGAHDTTGTGRV